jgi:hypothetical protein
MTRSGCCGHCEQFQKSNATTSPWQRADPGSCLDLAERQAAGHCIQETTRPDMVEFSDHGSHAFSLPARRTTQRNDIQAILYWKKIHHIKSLRNVEKSETTLCNAGSNVLPA